MRNKYLMRNFINIIVESSQPITVYHGGSGEINGSINVPFFTTTDERMARSYARVKGRGEGRLWSFDLSPTARIADYGDLRVIADKLGIEEFDDVHTSDFFSSKGYYEEFPEEVISAGFDAVFIHDFGYHDDFSEEPTYIVLNPEVLSNQKMISLISEQIVHRDTVKLNPGDWLSTVVAVNPTKGEFWSANFRQGKGDELEPYPSAAGLILTDGTVLVGTGHSMAHHDLCDLSGHDIDNELFRLQIYDQKVDVELWLPEGNGDGEVMVEDSLEDKIAAAEKMTGMTLEEIKTKVASHTERFVPGWQVSCLLWAEYYHSTRA